MFDYRTYPYRQVFEGYDGKLYYITRFSENKSTFQVEECPGEEVINFCEMDLTDYRKRFEEFDNIPFSPDKYPDMINTAYDLLDLLRPLHSFTHLFTEARLSELFNATIYVEDENSFEKVFPKLEENIRLAKDTLKEVIFLQDIFKFAINLCLDKENSPDRHVSEKLVGFLFKYNQFNNFAIKTGYALMPCKNGLLDYERVKYLNDNNITDTKEQLKVMHENGRNLSVISYSIIEYLHEMIYFEFMQIMKSGRQIKLCKNCGRYFVLKDKRKREYCDRIYKDGKRCSEVGNTNVFKNSLGEGDSPLKIAQTLYNKLYSRMDRARNKFPDELTDKDMSEDDFIKWSNLFSETRADFKEGKISGEEFIKKIWRD